MEIVTPLQCDRRSQLYRWHQHTGASFEALAGSVVVTAYADAEFETRQARVLALADLSTLPRTGFKGIGTLDWLNDAGLQLPTSPNLARRQADGSLLARLSENELLVLDDLGASTALPTRLEAQWCLDSTTGVYFVPRYDSHCWFALTGEHAAATLAKVCGVDLRSHKFAEYSICQTSLAKVNAIILCINLAVTPCFFIFSDVSSTQYLWEAIMDAMAEFNGCCVGLEALRALQAG